MVGVVDYGRGNLRSVVNSLKKLGVDASIVDTKDDLEKVERLIFPGVGAFKDCMDFIGERGLTGPILKHIESGKPFLGICLGFQVLFEESEEFGKHKGLGLFEGKVKRFSHSLKVPHMGWNTIDIKKENKLLSGVEDKSYFYFVHSYCVESTANYDDIATTTNYGVDFVSMVRRNNVFGTQFHPEKSQACGLRLLENFVSYV